MRLASSFTAGLSALCISLVLAFAWAPAVRAQSSTPVHTVVAPPGDRPVPPPPPAEEPEPEPVRPHLAEVDAILDPFWDFHIHARVGIPVHELVDVTVNAILWTNPELSRSGQQVWAETGVGARAILFDSRLWAGLEIGLTHGAFLSDGSTGVAFDGLAPRLVVDARVPITPVIGIDGYLEATIYMALRRGSAEARNGVRTIARAGAILFNVVAIGPYFEQFHRWIPVETTTAMSRSDNPTTWLGAYFEARIPLGLLVGGAAGLDFTLDDSSGDAEFYRVWVGWRG